MAKNLNDPLRWFIGREDEAAGTKRGVLRDQCGAINSAKGGLQTKGLRSPVTQRGRGEGGLRLSTVRT